MNQFSRIFLLLILLLVLGVPQALARLSGEVEWGYVNFEQSGGEGLEASASHFTQRYSMLYDMQGQLGSGRLGMYDLGVGAEWAAFNSNIDGDFGDETFSRDAFKLLYNGRLLVAPGALPFRLDAYSYDLSKMSFTSTWQPGLLSPDVVTDLRNGQTIVSGVQFMAGIRNGSYLGQYRDLMARWPRILVDYRDVYRRDLDAREPVEYRNQNLAFVSLNKKDNWFHYRVNTFDDYIRPEENTRESTILLGNIDHTLKRQWIHLSNWIRISADGAYTVYDERWDARDTERFDVNFFTAVERKGFAASSLVNLQRVKRDNRLEHTFNLPVYVNNRLNLDTSLRSTFELWRNKDMTSNGLWRNKDMSSNWGEEVSEEAYYARTLLEANQRGRLLVTPGLEIELHTGDVGEGEAIRGRVEVSSNPRYRPDPDWFGMASLASFAGESEYGEDASLWEGELKGGVNYRLRNSMRIGVEQYLLYGSGNYESQATHFMRPASSFGFGRYSGSGSQLIDTSLFRSETNLYYEHISSARVQNRLELSYRYEDTEFERLYNLELSHQLHYQSRGWRVRLNNLYSTGDDTDTYAPGTNELEHVAIQAADSGRFEHRGLIEFSPNHFWKARLEESLSWGDNADGESSQLIMVKQSLERNFYSVVGLKRKRGEVSQALEYEQLLNGKDRKAMTFSLTGKYFPKTWLQLGAGVYYHYYDYASNEIYYTLTTGINFPKFNVDFNYRYGAQEDTDIVAHRYEVNVRKTF